MAQPLNRMHTSNLHAWLMYFGDHKVSPLWGIHLEAQLRQQQNIADQQQLLLRTGINYHISPNAFLTAGYCFVETYPYGDFPVKVQFPEHRIWEQLQIKSNLSLVEWVSRFRLEQRLSNLPQLNTMMTAYEPGDAVYTNRFRLFNRFSFPLKGKTMKDKCYYLTSYTEFFVSFGQRVASNLFDQMRIYGAIGYVIPRLGRLEIGYLEQTVIKSDGIRVEDNHTLQLALISNLNFFK